MVAANNANIFYLNFIIIIIAPPQKMEDEYMKMWLMKRSGKI